MEKKKRDALRRASALPRDYRGEPNQFRHKNVWCLCLTAPCSQLARLFTFSRNKKKRWRALRLVVWWVAVAPGNRYQSRDETAPRSKMREIGKITLQDTHTPHTRAPQRFHFRFSRRGSRKTPSAIGQEEKDPPTLGKTNDKKRKKTKKQEGRAAKGGQAADKSRPKKYVPPGRGRCE